MRRNGFTLIELLVVIAIIAILAAILWPHMPWARVDNRTITIAKTWDEVSVSNGYSSTDYHASDTNGETYSVNGARVYGRLVEGRTYEVEVGRMLGGLMIRSVVSEVRSTTAEAVP